MLQLNYTTKRLDLRFTHKQTDRVENKQTALRKSAKHSKRMDARTVAYLIAKKKDQKEFGYSLIAIMMKFVFMIIASVSLFKIGLVLNERIQRENEIIYAFGYELSQYSNLSKRFDQLFAVGGEQRFMKEQDQLISPYAKRVIWQR
tara:strand:- start:21439 stop:21876 length:438 start_codon:yes stop_codon:yes gene_type:complete